ncbi:MAG: NAD-dependent epimerase/dehydratase family protein [Thermoguttaceae bacterium]|nr:NAD-dependent epimerase/dehydratase family protein [Thermoguttaceae bacterium]
MTDNLDFGETVFVTGATGFIGLRAVEALVERGKRVKCLTRRSSNRAPLEKLGVEFCDGDVCDLDSLKAGLTDVDVVFHFAGLTRELRFGEFNRVNCGGTTNVAAACAEIAEKTGRAPTLVVASSLAAAGPGLRGGTYRRRRPRKETDLPRPVSPYGRSKLHAERALLRFADVVPTTILRPPYVVGRRDLLSLQLYVIARNKGLFMIPGFRDKYYSFIEVGDLANLFLAAAAKGERLTPSSLDPLDDDPTACSGIGVYFPTSPKPLLFSEFGAAMGRGLGRRVRTVIIPPAGVWGAGVHGEIYKRIFHRYAAFDWNKASEAMLGVWICSGEKAISQLGYKFETPMATQMEEIARWYDQSGFIDVATKKK